MALIVKPEIGKVWASTGSKSTPPDTKIASGWGYEMMPFEWENWIQNRADTAIAHINQRGIAEWDIGTEYQANRSYVTGSDGVVYKALTTNTNINPTTDTGTNWRQAFVGIGAGGRVGIGRVATAYPLEVNGRIWSNNSFFVSNGGAYYLGDSGGVSNVSIDSPAASQMRFMVNNSTVEAMRIDASGNVGIGGAPVAKLDVFNTDGRIQSYSAVSTTGNRLLSVNTANTVALPLEISASDIRFTNGSNSVVGMFDASGNVGIGVAPSAWGGGAKAIDIGPWAAVAQDSGDGSAILTANAYDSGGGVYKYKQNSLKASLLKVNPNGSITINFAGAATAGSVINWTTVASLDASGLLLTNGATIGYGAGGAVTQTTSKSTSVTLHRPSGQITMHNAALAAGAVVSFAVNNNTIGENDVVCINLKAGFATNATYRCWVNNTIAGQFVVNVENRSAGSLSEAVVLSFVVIKGSTT